MFELLIYGVIINGAGQKFLYLHFLMFGRECFLRSDKNLIMPEPSGEAYGVVGGPWEKMSTQRMTESQERLFHLDAMDH